MSSWQCMTCRTVYADGVPACPHCEHVPAAPGTGYDGYPIRALRDMCRDRGLPVSGAKAELAARLGKHEVAA